MAKVNKSSATSNQKPIIVLVEDDSFLAGMYVSKLELEGFDVQLANDGPTGLKLIKDKKPMVVLLDIVLPNMDGFTVLKEIKKIKELKDTPVLLLTNLGQRHDVEKGLALGAADYLIKAHFMPSEVIEKIKRLVKK